MKSGAIAEFSAEEWQEWTVRITRCNAEKQAVGRDMVDAGGSVKDNYSNPGKRLWWLVNGSASG